MATFRETPYAAFNFLVSMDGVDPATPQGGFAEISGLSVEVEAIPYRAGNDRSLSPRLIPGLRKASSVTLKRGLVGDLGLARWLLGVADGAAERRDLVVSLLSEDRAAVAQAWRLRRALPVKYEGPRLDAAASEVAIETLILAVEGLDVE